jgi:hypothetical protein
MEDYSYLSNSVPLKNASVLFASAHGSVENTIFNNIRSILKSIIDRESPMFIRAMTDIQKFIYTKVLYSPMARTNTVAFSNKNMADAYLKYGYYKYNSLELNDITSSNLKTIFNNVRKYNVNELKDQYLIDYDELINYFRNMYNIPKMYNVIDLDENNEHLLLKPARPDAMFLKNKVDNPDVINVSWLIRENNKAILQIPLLKNSHPDDEFMNWVKDQIGIIPKLSKHQYDDINRAKTITSNKTLKKYYDNNNVKVNDLRGKLYKYVKYINNYVEDRIIEYHNKKQGHYMYDAIINEKTPEHIYYFVAKANESDEKKHTGLHRLLYLKDGKKRSNYETKSRPKYLNQLYCSLPKSNKQSLITPKQPKILSYDDIISYLKEALHYKICKTMNQNIGVPLSLIILHAWADNMDHLTIFAIACRKYHPNDINITDDPIRRKTSVRNSKKNNNIRPIRQSLKNKLGDKLKFNKHSKRKLSKRSSKIKSKICPAGSSINPKTGRCRKDCLPNQTRNNKGNCVKNKKLLTKKCPPGKELNPDTNRCRNKCEKTKIRNEKGNCVNKH